MKFSYKDMKTIACLTSGFWCLHREPTPTSESILPAFGSSIYFFLWRFWTIL